MKKVWMLLLAMIVSLGLVLPTYAQTSSYEAQIGAMQYATLSEALDAAKDGDTVQVLKDISTKTQYVDNANYSYGIVNKTITIDGNHHHIALTGGSRGFFVKGGESADTLKTITFKNITITNDQGNGRVIDTRGGYFDLILDHVTLSTEKGQGNTQVITVGSSHAHQNHMTIKDSHIIANDAGYSVIVFNPVQLNINHSNLTGYATLYMKDPNNSHGSRGSVVNVTNGSVLTTVNSHTSESDSSFGNICIVDPDVQVHIKDSHMLTKTTNTATQATVLFEDNTKGSTVVFDGNTKVDCFGDNALLVNDKLGLKQSVKVKSGTFNSVDVLNYLQAEAKVTVRLDKDITQSLVVGENTNVTLDLNGHKLVNTEGQHTILNKGHLTVIGDGVVDNTSHGKGALVNAKGTQATAIIKGGEWTRSKEAGTSSSQSGGNSWYVMSNEQGCTMIMDDAYVHSTGKYSSLIRNYGNMTIRGGQYENGFITIKNEEDSYLHITGGTITSETQAIQSYGDTQIDNGQINGQVTVSKWDKFDSSMKITGGNIQGDMIVWDDSTATGKVSTVIDGAHVSGDMLVWDDHKQPIDTNDKLNLDIYSGSFDKNVLKYVVDTKGLVRIDDVYYVNDSDTLKELVLDAQKSVEIISGIQELYIPEGITVINQSGHDVVINGQLLENGDQLISSKMTLNKVPTIEANNVKLFVGDQFDVLHGVKAYDQEDGDMTSLIKVIENNVNMNKVGQYLVTYQVSDKDGASVKKTIHVDVVAREVHHNNQNQSVDTSDSHMSMSGLLMGVTLSALMVLALMRVKKEY